MLHLLVGFSNSPLSFYFSLLRVIPAVFVQCSKLNQFVIHPLSLFRRFWDLLISVGVIYVCFEVPFALGFERYESEGIAYYFMSVLDVLFWIVST